MIGSGSVDLLAISTVGTSADGSTSNRFQAGLPVSPHRIGDASEGYPLAACFQSIFTQAQSIAVIRLVISLCLKAHCAVVGRHMHTRAAGAMPRAASSSSTARQASGDLPGSHLTKAQPRVVRHLRRCRRASDRQAGCTLGPPQVEALGRPPEPRRQIRRPRHTTEAVNDPDLLRVAAVLFNQGRRRLKAALRIILRDGRRDAAAAEQPLATARGISANVAHEQLVGTDQSERRPG